MLFDKHLINSSLGFSNPAFAPSTAFFSIFCNRACKCSFSFEILASDSSEVKDDEEGAGADSVLDQACERIDAASC